MVKCLMQIEVETLPTTYAELHALTVSLLESIPDFQQQSSAQALALWEVLRAT